MTVSGERSGIGQCECNAGGFCAAGWCLGRSNNKIRRNGVILNVCDHCVLTADEYLDDESFFCIGCGAPIDPDLAFQSSLCARCPK